jgi:hypothetical protein
MKEEEELSLLQYFFIEGRHLFMLRFRLNWEPNIHMVINFTMSSKHSQTSQENGLLAIKEAFFGFQAYNNSFRMLN